MNKEEKKTRKRKIENIEDSVPVDVGNFEVLRYNNNEGFRTKINNHVIDSITIILEDDNKKIEIKNDYWNDRYHNKYREKIIMRNKEIITCECGATLKRGNLWNHRKLSKIYRKNMMKINGDKYILDKSFGVK